tara:strand:- start:8307 stop:9218 length:912 start_codon:yes stop_codon:yes gene_type:complete
MSMGEPNEEELFASAAPSQAQNNAPVQQETPAQQYDAGLANIDFSNIGEAAIYSGGYYNGTVNNVGGDPDAIYANITRQEFLDYQRNYGAFENELIQSAQNDTSLIDAAKEDSATASALMSGVASRNEQRYGANLTPMQRREQERALQRGTTLGRVQSVNDARIAQKETNQRTLADLINIGQGINRSSQSQLGSAAADATTRKNAYESARAQSKAQTYQTVGSLASTAILAFAFMSDRRSKQNVKQVGVSTRGVNIYEYNYIGSKQRYQGVMADEVPWAVIERDNDYNLVDYSKVDVEFKKVS